MVIWKELTPYAQNNTKHNPRLLIGEVSGIYFSIQRGIDTYDEHIWLLNCEELDIDRDEINEEDVESAKICACETISFYLQIKKNQIESAINSLAKEVNKYD